MFGIDGADPRVFERLLAEGRLPVSAALKSRGCYFRLGTTNPAQTPVSWSSFSTGSNPGKTGIYDFLRRDPAHPGRIQLSLAERDLRPGPIPEDLRGFLPWIAGAVVGLLFLGLAGIVLRVLGTHKTTRNRVALAVGLAGAVGAGVLARRAVGWVPREVPFARNLREGTPLWTILGDAGISSRVLLAPVSFPADRGRNLRLLSGLGTPDVQGAWGLYEVLTDDPKSPVTTETSGLIDWLGFDASGTAYSRVYGPEDVTLTFEQRVALGKAQNLARLLFDQAVGVPSMKRTRERVAAHAAKAGQASCVLEVRRDAAARTATVRVGSGGPRPGLDVPFPEPVPGAPPVPAAALPAPGDPSVSWGEPITVREGEWSAFVPFEFRMNPLVRVRGLAQLYLESAGAPKGPFRLHLTPVSFDPRDLPPNVELSFPKGYAPSLASEAGLYETIGWACLTNPVKDSVLPDEGFVLHLAGLTDRRRRLLLNEAAKPDWRFLFVLFGEVDRVQHAFWRHIDPESPTYDALRAARFAGEIDKSYVAMDRILGEAIEKAGKDTAVIVMSDHGFAPFRRGVNLNTWLKEKGFLVLKGEPGGGGLPDDRNVGQIFSGTDFFSTVDWSKTKAYALGLGQIYLNLAGRERDGCVKPAEVDAVCKGIRDGLLELKDAEKGDAKVVREVYLGKDIFRGPTAKDRAPDLVLGFEWGYRVSWQTCLGGGGEKVIEDNLQPWSGDHCSVDPSLVPGILLSSEPLAPEGANVIDVAPTVLDLFGIPPPKEWDGRSLLRKGR